jgi:hypothetical protein
MTEPYLPLTFLVAALAFGFVVASLPQRRRRRRKMRATRPIPAAWTLESLMVLVHTVPWVRLNPREQAEVVTRLREADRGAVSMREHGRINLVLGEIALATGDREEARIRFGAALRWDPRLPIRRTVERLENPVSLLSITTRRAA